MSYGGAGEGAARRLWWWLVALHRGDGVSGEAGSCGCCLSRWRFQPPAGLLTLDCLVAGRAAKDLSSSTHQHATPTHCRTISVPAPQPHPPLRKPAAPHLQTALHTRCPPPHIFPPSNPHAPRCRPAATPLPLPPPPQKEALDFISTSDCPDYLRKAERRLHEEVERCAAYLDATTEPKITRVVETELLRNQVGGNGVLL